ncbi:hypothetical protein J4402_00540 [Candidatus Pacearchaeota archaeon]|nr:hypothetical protein [Candidatus Pacearchaeota archaeon]
MKEKVLIIFGIFILLVGGVFAAECNDGIDNDGDGLVDSADRGCRSIGDINEGDDVMIGTNLNWVNDWSTEWVFVDVMKTARMWFTQNFNSTNPFSTGLIDKIPLREDGYPIKIPAEVPGVPTPQVVGTLLLRDNGGHHPDGNYTVLYEGDGELRFDYNAIVVKQEPHKIIIYVSNKSSSGIFLRIMRSNESDPVRNIRVIMPGFEDNYSEQIFHPLFLERYKPYKIFRFMQWMNINDGNDISSWDERNKPTDFSQARVHIKNGNISSIVNTSIIQYHSCSWNPLYSVLVTTSEPHGLFTGQEITLNVTNDTYFYRDSSGVERSASINGRRFVYVADETHFYIGFGDWRNSNLTSFPTGSFGTWKNVVAPGVSVEYMVELSNRLDVDPWFNVPYAARDEYIRNFAQYVKDNLDKNKTIYVEYANEVWNSAAPYYPQFSYSCGYAGIKNIAQPASTADLAKFSWDIWRDVFGNESYRIKRVVAGQRVNSWVVSTMTNRLNQTSSDGGFDVISVAPYFYPDNLSALNENSSTEDVKNETIAYLKKVTMPKIEEHLALRDKWEKELGREIDFVGYEGGSAFVPELNTPYYNAYLEIQNSSAMYDLYKIVLRWARNKSIEGIVFYNSGGLWSWGHLHYQDQPIEEAPKFRALMDGASGKIYLDESFGNCTIKKAYWRIA